MVFQHGHVPIPAPRASRSCPPPCFLQSRETHCKGTTGETLGTDMGRCPHRGSTQRQEPAARERQQSSRGRDKCGNNLPREAGTSSDKGTAGGGGLQGRQGPEGKMTPPAGGGGVQGMDAEPPRDGGLRQSDTFIRSFPFV